jgi:hypothetical protein
MSRQDTIAAMNKPTFEIVDLGVDHPDYFQGFGVSFTRYDYCTYGIGDTAQEAYDDALDSMCQQGEHAQTTKIVMASTRVRGITSAYAGIKH